MTKINELLVWSPSIEPTVARLTVVASCDEPVEGMRLEGRLQGPACAYARTVDGETPLVSEPVVTGITAEATVQATGEVMEPCLWEPGHPFLYEMHVQLHQGDRILDEHHLGMGIRHLACDEQGLRLNGTASTLSVARIPDDAHADESSFRHWREAGCRAMVVEHVTVDLLRWADRWGVFVLVRLDRDSVNSQQTDGAGSISTWRLHPSVAMWLVDNEGSIDALRRRDPFRPIALACRAESLPTECGADLFAVTGSIDEMTVAASHASKPVLACCEIGRTLEPETIQDVFDNQHKKLGDTRNLVGFVV